MQQELIQTQKPESQAATSLVRLTLTRMTETTDPQLQAELVGAFDQVLAEISASAVTGIERLLAQEAAICWVELQKLRSTQARVGSAPRANQAVWWVHAVSAAQLRLFRAFEELARVRRLAVPVGNG